VGPKSQGGKKPSGSKTWQEWNLGKMNRDDIYVISWRTREQVGIIEMLNI
jgi:hypothetical protein